MDVQPFTFLTYSRQVVLAVLALALGAALGSYDGFHPAQAQSVATCVVPEDGICAGGPTQIVVMPADWPDGVDQDGDGLVDEDPGIGLDDDGDTLIDEDTVDDDRDGRVNEDDPDDDGDGLVDEDPEDDIDNDGDTLVDEDPPASECMSSAYSVCDNDLDGLIDEDPVAGIDDDGDTLVDEESVDDDGDTVIDEDGSQFIVEIRVEDFTDADDDGDTLPEGLGAFKIRLVYDPNVVSFWSVSDSAEVEALLLGTTGRSVICAAPLFGFGFVQLECGTVEASPAGPTGSGVLARVGFHPGPQADTSTELTLTTTLVDVPANPEPHGSQGGTVVVLDPLADTDGDGVLNGYDNCALVPNPGQENSDSGPPLSGTGAIGNGKGVPEDDVTVPNGDFLGDACDDDLDNDGIPNASDADPGGDITYDDDNDGAPCPPLGTDAADDGPSWDSDCNGVLDGFEPSCPLAANPTGDDDSDGLENSWEVCKWGTDPNVVDSDGDALGDCVEAADVDGDGFVDFVGDAIAYSKAALLPPADFGQDGDFDINGDGFVDFVGDVTQEARFALIPGLCK